MSENGMAVFFDVGNTLLKADPPVPDVFARVARRLGYEITVRDVEPFMSEVDEFYEAEYLKDGDFWCDHDRAVNLWLDMYTILANRCELEGDIPYLAQAVYDEYLNPSNWSLFGDVQACLKGLKRRGFKLGVISNWDATLERLLRSIGSLPYLDDVVASAAVGYRKPSSAIFEIALERMGVDAAHAIHVGDLPEADGDGAFNAGIRPVIIDRNGRFPDCRYETIKALTDLVSLL